MNKYIETATALRNDPNVHYSCAQATLLPFSRELGIDDETALKFSANFGSGMKSGTVCGAISGGLMAMGLMGIDSSEKVTEFWRKIKSNHNGNYECRDLLCMCAEAGIPKKQHCDGLVYEVVEIVAELADR